MRTLVERFWAKVDKSGDCWVWTRATGRNGYGKINVEGKYAQAHRLALEWALGEPLGARLALHGCDNPPCVRVGPGHVYPGTPRRNNLDRVERDRDPNATKTHCKSGHEFTEANTYRRPDRPTSRVCRACNNEASLKHYPNRKKEGTLVTPSDMTDGLLGRAFDMIRREWCAGEDTITFCNHQVVALAEESGEAMEHRWNGSPLFAELADVVIVANMLSFEFRGRPVALRWATVLPSPARPDAMMDVAEAVGKVAKVWRQISGQRRRASSQPFTLTDMDAALTRVVTAARAVPPAGTVLPLADKLSRVLARGRSLDSSEAVR